MGSKVSRDRNDRCNNDSQATSFPQSGGNRQTNESDDEAKSKDLSHQETEILQDKDLKVFPELALSQRNQILIKTNTITLLEVQQEQTIGDKKGTIDQIATKRQISKEVQRQCPICFESAYKNPKILPCSHTFCLPCLKDHMRNKHCDDMLICPICRANIHIPEGGVKAFLENFFVIADDESSCDICREIEGKKICKNCEKSICVICLKGHKCQKLASRRWRPFRLYDSSSSSDTDTDSSSVNSDASVPYSFTRPSGIWTKILLKEDVKFCIEEGANCISIVPISENEAWILKADSEVCSIGLYDTNGFCKENIPLPTQALGFTVEESNTLLICFPEENTVRRYSRTEGTIFVSSSVFQPFGVAVLPDHCIVIAGCDKDNMAEVSMGCVKIMSHIGEVLQKFDTGYELIPFSVGVLNNDLLCFAYPQNNCVDIRLRDGNVVGRYNGNHDEDSSGFDPLSVCTGLYCNKPVVFISDYHSETVHVISYAAEFIGLALKSKLWGSDFNEIGGIGYDSSGKLWIGQREDNTISKFSICKYSNIME